MCAPRHSLQVSAAQAAQEPEALAISRAHMTFAQPLQRPGVKAREGAPLTHSWQKAMLHAHL